jgi:hypothetical protein
MPAVVNNKMHEWLQINTIDVLRALSYSINRDDWLPTTPSVDLLADPTPALRIREEALDAKGGVRAPTATLDKPDDSLVVSSKNTAAVDPHDGTVSPQDPSTRAQMVEALDGSIRTIVTKTRTDCVDTLGHETETADLGLYACHYSGGNQGFWFTPQLEIRVKVKQDEMCLDAWGEMPAQVRRGPCHGQGGNQAWIVEKSGTIRHGQHSVHPNGCIEAATDSGGVQTLIVAPCDPTRTEQLWDLPAVVLRSEL